jgi:hypothetical protein
MFHRLKHQSPKTLVLRRLEIWQLGLEDIGHEIIVFSWGGIICVTTLREFWNIVTINGSQARYTLETAILHGMLLNRTVVIPSFVYARSCKYGM